MAVKSNLAALDYKNVSNKNKTANDIPSLSSALASNSASVTSPININKNVALAQNTGLLNNRLNTSNYATDITGAGGNINTQPYVNSAYANNNATKKLMEADSKRREAEIAKQIQQNSFRYDYSSYNKLLADLEASKQYQGFQGATNEELAARGGTIYNNGQPISIGGAKPINTVSKEVDLQDNTTTTDKGGDNGGGDSTPPDINNRYNYDPTAIADAYGFRYADPADIAALNAKNYEYYMNSIPQLFNDYYKPEIDNALNRILSNGNANINRMYDANYTSIQNMINALRANAATGLTTNAAAGLMAGQNVQSILGASNELSQATADVINNNIKNYDDNASALLQWGLGQSSSLANDANTANAQAVGQTANGLNQNYNYGLGQYLATMSQLDYQRNAVKDDYINSYLLANPGATQADAAKSYGDYAMQSYAAQLASATGATGSNTEESHTDTDTLKYADYVGEKGIGNKVHNYNLPTYTNASGKTFGPLSTWNSKQIEDYASVYNYLVKQGFSAEKASVGASNYMATGAKIYDVFTTGQPWVGSIDYKALLDENRVPTHDDLF